MIHSQATVLLSSPSVILLPYHIGVIIIIKIIKGYIGLSMQCD